MKQMESYLLIFLASLHALPIRLFIIKLIMTVNFKIRATFFP